MHYACMLLADSFLHSVKTSQLSFDEKAGYRGAYKYGKGTQDVHIEAKR